MTTTKSLPSVSDKISTGGFGVLYNDPRDRLQCIKVLKKPLTGDAARSLHRLVDIVHWTRPSDRHHLLSRFAWPVELFGTIDQVNGYAMPLAPQSCFFNLQVANKTSRSPLQLKFLIDSEYWAGPAIRSEKPSVPFQEKIGIALDCINSIEILHENGLCYGDVSSNNIVARLDSRSPGVFFFDADSITTVEQRSAQPLVTPDWEAPADLDPWAIDRSRVALLVFRLLAMRPLSRPHGDQLSLLSVHEGGQLSRVLAQTYTGGSPEAFASLAHQLRRLRDQASARESMDDAIRSGFARVVLRDRPASMGVEDLHLAEQAQKQVEFEQRIDQAEGRELRHLMRIARNPGNPFALDTRKVDERPPPPSSPEQLHDLIADARFVEIGDHLAAAALGSLERDSWLHRAIEHAHVEIDQVTLQVIVQPGAGDLSFTWPLDGFVNIAEIAVNGAEISQVEVVQRTMKAATATVSISAPLGTTGVASLRLGTIGATGLTVMSPRSTEVALAIPAVPKPPATARPGNRALAASRAPIMFDPVKAAAAEAAQRLAIRRRRQRNASLACTLVLFLGAAGWLFLSGASPPDRPPLTVVVGSAVYRLEVDGDVVSVAWTGLPPDIDRLVVSESSDGQVWRALVTTMGPEGDSAFASIPASNGEPLLLRLQHFDEQGFVPEYRAQASWLDGSGLQSQPVAGTKYPGWLDVSWAPATEGAIPVSYEFRTSHGISGWRVEATTGTRVFRSAPAVTGRLFFAVRSVFADGTKGPWIETSTLPESTPDPP